MSTRDYMPYEGLYFINHKSRKLVVFGRKLGGGGRIPYVIVIANNQ